MSNSKTGKIIEAIEQSIKDSFSYYKKSPYRYTFDKCGANGNDNVFRVYQGSSESQDGVSKRSAQNKHFKVTLSKEFVIKDDSDSFLQDKLDEIELEMETIINSAMNNFNTNLINNVVSFTTDDPLIDAQELTVSYTITFTINYFMRF